MENCGKLSEQEVAEVIIEDMDYPFYKYCTNSVRDREPVTEVTPEMEIEIKKKVKNPENWVPMLA